MELIGQIAQVAIALGIFNVWLLRYGKSTSYRGSSANNMREEFDAYGLPAWFMYTIGALKLTLAVLLIVGLWVTSLVVPAALGMAVLMLGAVAMHIKVKDPPIRALPAVGMLALSIIAAAL